MCNLTWKSDQRVASTHVAAAKTMIATGDLLRAALTVHHRRH